MSEFHARSFDPPRVRPAPRTLAGLTALGERREIELVAMTLVVAVKPQCRSCQTLLEGGADDFGATPLVVVCAKTPSDDEWRDAQCEVLVAPGAMAALGISSPPQFVVVDGRRSLVVGEGVFFTTAQVAGEIAPYFRP